MELIPDYNPAHPDQLIIDQQAGSIGIDIARDIKRFGAARPLKSSRKHTLILNAHRLTTEAQNALLKTLEESPAYHQIILVTDKPDSLVSTISSRCRYLYRLQPQTAPINNKVDKIIQALFNQSPGDRVHTVTAYALSRANAQAFLSQLVHYLHHKLHRHPTINTAANLTLAHQGIHRLDQNANPALTLEHVVLSLK
jgi:DNA polymerase III gamma/tau subunit